MRDAAWHLANGLLNCGNCNGEVMAINLPKVPEGLFAYRGFAVSSGGVSTQHTADTGADAKAQDRQGRVCEMVRMERQIRRREVTNG